MGPIKQLVIRMVECEWYAEQQYEYPLVDFSGRNLKKYLTFCCILHRQFIILGI